MLTKICNSYLPAAPFCVESIYGTQSPVSDTRRYCLFNDNMTGTSFSRVYHRMEVTVIILFVFGLRWKIYRLLLLKEMYRLLLLKEMYRLLLLKEIQVVVAKGDTQVVVAKGDVQVVVAKGDIQVVVAKGDTQVVDAEGDIHIEERSVEKLLVGK